LEDDLDNGDIMCLGQSKLSGYPHLPKGMDPSVVGTFVAQIWGDDLLKADLTNRFPLSIHGRMIYIYLEMAFCSVKLSDKISNRDKELTPTKFARIKSKSHKEMPVKINITNTLPNRLDIVPSFTSQEIAFPPDRDMPLGFGTNTNAEIANQHNARGQRYKEEEKNYYRMCFPDEEIEEKEDVAFKDIFPKEEPLYLFTCETDYFAGGGECHCFIPKSDLEKGCFDRCVGIFGYL